VCAGLTDPEDVRDPSAGQVSAGFTEVLTPGGPQAGNVNSRLATGVFGVEPLHPFFLESVFPSGNGWRGGLEASLNLLVRLAGGKCQNQPCLQGIARLRRGILRDLGENPPLGECEWGPAGDAPTNDFNGTLEPSPDLLKAPPEGIAVDSEQRSGSALVAV
jgi:hypothetical protein